VTQGNRGRAGYFIFDLGALQGGSASFNKPHDKARRAIESGEKFDPVERDFRNRSLGKAGEAFVIELERDKLAKAERSDLAKKVRWAWRASFI
jgi:hypothetical protein